MSSEISSLGKRLIEMKIYHESLLVLQYEGEIVEFYVWEEESELRKIFRE